MDDWDVIGDWLSKPGQDGKAEPVGLFIEAPVGGAPDVAAVEPGRRAVPLKERRVSATVYASGSFADTRETLTYCSDDTDCTAIFRFPLPPRSAVYKFSARIGDREVVTRVKPRAEAREEYTLAVQQGHSAVHLEQHASGCSLFEVSVGNLPARTPCVVQLHYLRLLDSFGSSTLEWAHTATWVPPYQPAPAPSTSAAMADGGDTVVGSTTQGSSAPTAAPAFAEKVSYTLSYEVTVVSDPSAPVKSIQSAEPIDVTVVTPAAGGSAAAGGPDSSRADGGKASVAGVTATGGAARHVVTLAGRHVADPSKDFSLLIELQPPANRSSCLHVQRCPATDGSAAPRTVALATFVPPLPDKPQQQQSQAGGGTTSALAREVWLVVDCSGSMSGSPIRQAKEAALFLVRDLPVDSGVRFNVTCFGSGHKTLHGSGCVPYTAASERSAVAWMEQHVEANMGGTEVLATLTSIYKTPLTPGYTREIVFLTDGGVDGGSERAVHDLVTPPPPTPSGTPLLAAAAADLRNRMRSGSAAAASTHVHCLGIGHGVHRSLVDGMATRSSGACVYVADGEPLGPKVAFLKRCALAEGAALRPRITTRGAMVRAAPHVLPARVFAGQPVRVLLEVVASEADAELVLEAEYGVEGAAGEGGWLAISLPLGKEAAAAAAAAAAAGGNGAGGGDGSGAVEGEALGVLHAMAYIGCLMSGRSPLHVRPDGAPLLQPPTDDTVREAVVRLAVAAQLVTPYTSAVGVALRRDPLDPQRVDTSEVPLQLPHGRTLWGTHRPSGSGLHLLASSPRCGAAPAPVPSMCAAPALCPGGAHWARPARHQNAIAVPAAIMCSGGGGEGGGFGSSLARGEKMESLACKSAEDLQEQSALFFRATKEVKGGHSLAIGAVERVRSGFASLFGGGRSSSPPDHNCERDRERFSVASAGEDEEEDVSEGAAPSSADGSSIPGQQEQQQQRPLAGDELLSYLNRSRDTRGFWTASPQLAAALGLPAALLAGGGGGGEKCDHPAAALRPAGLSDDGWATLVVLGVLRSRLAGSRAVWADMEAKAVGWLEGGVWPQGQQGSVAGAVLALAKVV